MVSRLFVLLILVIAGLCLWYRWQLNDPARKEPPVIAEYIDEERIKRAPYVLTTVDWQGLSNRVAVRRNFLPMVVALLAGSITAMVSAVAIAWALGAPSEILASLAPKSVTAPIAMALTETIGGIPALTAVLVVLTGILGSVIVTPLMNAFGIRDYAARGFAVGIASHGIGTARAFQVSEEAGTFAGIAMGLNGAMTALVFAVLALFI